MRPYLSPEASAYAALLANSFYLATGLSLPDEATALWLHPQPLVSHGTQADPIFRYANLAALTLWETDWKSFTQMPSRLSAQADAAIQSDRSAHLAAALACSHVADYQGIRISAKGKRFRIADTILWNVTDAEGLRHGQAALIGNVRPL